MESMLLLLFVFCIGGLVYLKVKDERSACYNPKSFFGRATNAGKKFKSGECTVEHLLKIIPNTANYRDKYVKILARRVSYTNIQQLEQVRASIAAHRPHLFGEIQAADINKPIF